MTSTETPSGVKALLNRFPIFSATILVSLGLVVALAVQSSRAQQTRPFDLTGAIDIAGAANGSDLVITIPPGSPPFELYPIPNVVIEVPGQTMPPGSGLVVEFPKGGKIIFNPCVNRRLSITGQSLLVKPFKAPLQSPLKQPN